jgi:transketolase
MVSNPFNSFEYKSFVDTKIRRAIAETFCLAYLRGDGHIVSCIGTIEVLCNLFAYDFDFTHDSLVLSKGHSALALYSSLYEFERISEKDLLSFRLEESNFGIHISRSLGNLTPLASGSLGHGIGYGTGIAMSRKIKNEKGRVFVIVGDGEMNEGSNFEAMQIASKNEVNNLIVLVDHNRVQSVSEYYEVSGDLQIMEKFKAFGFEAFQIEDTSQLPDILSQIEEFSKSPSAIVCDTSVASSLPSIQSRVLWHYRKPNIDEVKEIFDLLDIETIGPDILKMVNA